jgi:hypothetical protein
MKNNLNVLRLTVIDISSCSLEILASAVIPNDLAMDLWTACVENEIATCSIDRFDLSVIEGDSKFEATFTDAGYTTPVW